jgi:hypothetical protein
MGIAVLNPSYVLCTYMGYTLAKEVVKMRWPGIADPPSEPMSSSTIVGWVEPEAIPIKSY